MNNSNYTPELWQVEVNGQIYDASFEELTQWIAESALLPQDKVRRGNLPWREAGNVRSLNSFFNARGINDSPPLTLNVTDAGSSEAVASLQIENPTSSIGAISAHNHPANFAQPADIFSVKSAPIVKICQAHPNETPKFICEACLSYFCKSCPASYGGKVKICPKCGQMCSTVDDYHSKKEKNDQYQNDLSQGFCLADFFAALAYPFKFKFSLISGAVLFMFFSLGQNASSVGGTIMFGVSLASLMMANALTFGCLSNTINNMSQGKINENFMASFEDFSIWEDVVHPFFLSLGVYFVSFGLLIVLLIGVLWYTINELTSEPQGNLTNISQKVEENTKNIRLNQKGEYILENQQELKPNTLNEDDEIVELDNLIKQHRQSQVESVIGKNPETDKKENMQIMQNLLNIGIPFIILAFFAALWGLFYFPAACAVAGYTQSFKATINPLVGLDTIKRMGLDYAKVLGMCLIIGIMSVLISGFINKIFSPLDLPSLGNLPAQAVIGVFTFYFSIVFAVLLGFALYKNSSKLNLYR